MNPRLRLNLNRDWQFQRDDRGVWEEIGLPHSFDLPYFRTPEFYVGGGEYRKTLEMPAEWHGRRISLEFDGVFQIAQIRVNDRPAGEHAGGYTGFCIDITELLGIGENHISIRVNNNWNPRLCPRAGEHIFCGGIYRDVHLLVSEALHVTWNGASVTTPQVSRESASARVIAEICNESSEVKQCRWVAGLVDPDGRVVATASTSQSVPAGQTIQMAQNLEPIIRPHLWHPDHPNLYKIITEIFDGDRLADRVETMFGFRWFQWTADRGFFLNGEHLYLRGANAHQDHAGWGIAVTAAGCGRDVRLLKEAGFNFVRGAHYPHHPAFADACDRLGLIFWSENCFWGKGGFGPEGYWNASAYPVNPDDFEPFENHCKQTLGEMIRINRNHPSIVAWSMTNEAFFTYNLDRARNLMRDLVQLSRQRDPTRPAAIGGAQRGDVDKLGDIAGYNGDGARLFIDPKIPNMVSEYGAISKPVDAFDPFFGELQSEQFPWRAGEAIWCGFDYGSIAGRQGLKGILRHDRLPKRSWHWYRQELLGIAPPSWPMMGTPAKLRLSADKTTISRTDATDDCQIIVTVLDSKGTHIADCPPVTLTIESGPGEFPTGGSITFDASTDITIAQGQAATAFRSYHDGETLIRATSPGLESASIVITTIGEPQFIAGSKPSADRPYIPTPQSPAAMAAMKNAVNVARDRPIRAGSESPPHPARFANDASESTFWQANEPAEAWIEVDLEGFYQLSSCKLIFPAAGNWRFKIETSNNRADWNLTIDRTNSPRTDSVRSDVFDPGTVARYVRMTFTGLPPGSPAALTEIELQGVLSTR